MLGSRPVTSAPIVAAAAAAVALFAASDDAHAFRCTESNQARFVSIHWRVRQIRYAIREPGPRTMSAAEAERIIQESFNAWSNPRCTDLAFTYAGVVTEDTDPRQVSQVIFTQGEWPHEPGQVALTTMTYGKDDGEIRFGIIEVNESDWAFTDAASGCADPSAYDLGAVLTHEAGHFLGLAHTEQALVLNSPEDPTMTAVVDACDSNFRSLAADDIEGICYIYPAAAETRDCAPLPEQTEPYVSSQAFACAAGGPARPRDGFGLLLASLALLLLRRRNTVTR